ncbi:ABC transporter permease [Streptomyces sp. G-G2]|uniref:ABC transporter permease n=1 Tax=Streptomyces sp. G-G2 TaxID=3046201 RepID=UPI0024B9B43C|nr:ABC transporter permease [Streptomyces sp. G-G2]MDJ0383596.1 ABC transporter permease [Streptomyces sp. G-G2]
MTATAAAIPTIPVLHSEWIKIRSLRSAIWALAAILLSTVGIQAFAAVTIGQAEAESPGGDPLRMAFYGINFGQIAAITFGAKVFAAEFHNGALWISLSAVPNRTLFYLSKVAVVGGLALLVGQLAGLGGFFAGQGVMGERAIGPGTPGVVRAIFGSGLYLALMVLFAAGLTAVLRSGTVVLSVLVPFILLASFVLADTAGGVGQYLPDRAGQIVMSTQPSGDLGPWAGLGVMALWVVAALVAGWWAVRRRDA